MKQALTDVLSDRGKASGVASDSIGTDHTLYHASAGLDGATATLLYVIINGVSHIIAIAQHVIVKKCQTPAYDVLCHDPAYKMNPQGIRLLGI
ncbi:MAG: hypothetical protein V4534_02405 [Myxococcota bacterium]